MGLEPQENKKRNEDLIKDYQSGMGSVELVSKYQISSQRIYQITHPKRKNDVETNQE